MANTTPSIQVHNDSFSAMVKGEPSFTLLASSVDQQNLYHEACIYHASTRSVFVTSNQLTTSETRHGNTGKKVILWQIFLDNFNTADDQKTHGNGPAQVLDVTPASVTHSFLNGGVNFDDSHILLCAQGTLPQDQTEYPENTLSGLVLMNTSAPYDTRVLLPDFHGIPFNSVNDVIVHPEDQSIWFTDPCYGWAQKVRDQPQLPNQVYRYDVRTKAIRAVADGFTRPNGLCFAPDLKTIYVTDTGAIHGSSEVGIDLTGPSHIYAFDIVYEKSTAPKDEPSLRNRRLFAYAPGRFPDGIKCDTKGNVYSGCGNGVQVWNPNGVLIGTIQVPGGVANFCFGEKGEMFMCNETKFWRVQLNSDEVRGHLLGL